ncbi:FAD-dependent oxidoreductase [Bacillus sp. NPDC094077]|uniref:FAD-dependent oxidoreductase n=1 Tax=Bacillus sp. NPDC094077 TaxID=3390932 RepID=UPI003D0038D5
MEYCIDCAGSAGLNASLVLGKARKQIVLFDNKTNRNRVTKKSHGFITDPIRVLHGEEGNLNQVEFYSRLHIERSGGGIVPSFFRPNQFIEQLGCELQSNETFVIDDFGRTSEKNIYLAGETTIQGPSSLIIAASQGNKAAIAINSDSN